MIHAYTRTYIHTCTYIHTYTCMHTYIHMQAYIRYMRILTPPPLYHRCDAYIQTDVRPYVYTYVHTYIYTYMCTGVLARISKMPVQNSNSKISTRPHLATNLRILLKHVVATTFNSLLCQNGNLHFSYVLKDCLLWK